MTREEPAKRDAAAPVRERQRWMGILARARSAELEEAYARLPHKPTFQWQRRPETGLVMVRGRTGGTGAPFNFGEVTVTRCALRIHSHQMGIAHVRGRDTRHAELAALFDAMLQRPDSHKMIAETVIAPLAASQAQAREVRGRKTNATRVEFFTVVRGDNPA